MISIDAEPTHHITIEGELADLNTYSDETRTNRYLGADVKALYTNFVRLQTLNKHKPVQDYPVFILMVWTTKDIKKDPDNIAFAKKFILDALVINKILTNDGRKQIMGFADLFSVDKLRPKIDVYIYTAK